MTFYDLRMTFIDHKRGYLRVALLLCRLFAELLVERRDECLTSCSSCLYAGQLVGCTENKKIKKGNVIKVKIVKGKGVRLIFYLKSCSAAFFLAHASTTSPTSLKTVSFMKWDCFELERQSPEVTLQQGLHI